MGFGPKPLGGAARMYLGVPPLRPPRGPRPRPPDPLLNRVSSGGGTPPPEPQRGMGRSPREGLAAEAPDTFCGRAPR